MIIENIATRHAFAETVGAGTLSKASHDAMMAGMAEIDRKVANATPSTPEERAAMLGFLSDVMAEDDAEPLYRQLLSSALR